jgi:hypothetical protein
VPDAGRRRFRRPADLSLGREARPLAIFAKAAAAEQVPGPALAALGTRQLADLTELPRSSRFHVGTGTRGVSCRFHDFRIGFGFAGIFSLGVSMTLSS